MEIWIDLAWRLAIVVVVSVAATFAWLSAARWLAPWDKPFRSDAQSATIRPWPPLWWLFALLLGAMTLVGFVSALVSGSIVIVAIMLPMAAIIGALAWYALLMCLPSAWVSWNERSIEGPTSAFSTSRRELAWTDIVHVRRFSGTTYFENAQGQRVVWSDAHIGGRFLWGFLLHKRPDLKQQLDQLARANG